jgi:prepilin-type N-terminal cleavage/methylation domain-containing protein
MPVKSRHFRGFSLIEVSVVIIIIGIFVAGIFVADGMISKFRITAAKSLTQSSPITALPSSALWLETSLDSSFNSGETQNGSDLSAWYDQRNASSKVVISAAGASPTYSNTINRIHAVEFDGAANKYFTFDGSFLNKSDYTIFVLEKRKDSKSDNYFLGETGAGLNNSLALGYSANNQIIHAQGANSYPSGISSYSDSKDKPRIFTFTHSGITGNQTYINGVLAAENTDPDALAHLTGISTLAIGKGYVGEIGELAIFTEALEVADRASVEDYLGKKWTSSINRNQTPNCVGGLVTVGGCDNSAPIICSASGTGYNQTGLTYTSGAAFSCNTSGYSGTISYKCLASGPASNISGSCVATTCTAPSGTGYSAQSGLAYSTGSGTFGCDVGFTGSKTYTCTASGVATGISGTCTAITCTTPSGTGYNAQSALAYSTGSGTFSCDAAGFTGSKTYTCNASGVATGISGTCTAITCTAPSGAGYLAQTGLAYAAGGSGTFGCDTANGYTGTKNYTCTTAGVATGITGTCTVAGPCTVSGATNGTHTLNSSAFSGSTIHVFVATSAAGGASATFTFTCPTARNVQVLVVGGGGGGGGCISGGGGAGGLIYSASYAVSAGNTSVTVGVGGSGGNGWSTSQQHGKKGANSVFGSLTAIGGGGGVDHRYSADPMPKDGGSGGGDALHNQDGVVKSGWGVGSSGQGNNGGACSSNCYDRAGGGGGSGSAGGNSSGSVSGVGGSGLYYGTIFSNSYGHSGWFASGGSGGVRSGTGSVGAVAQGGGGIGSVNTTGAVSGMANTGGGGGGAGFDAGNSAVVGGNGGSGIVIVRYVN